MIIPVLLGGLAAGCAAPVEEVDITDELNGSATYPSMTTVEAVSYTHLTLPTILLV